MKVFIVFLALIVIFSMFLSYLQDTDRYMQYQKLLKMLSEDCAEAGALTIDPKTGVISGGRAFEAASEILESSSLFPRGSVSVESASVTCGGKGFEVCLIYSGEDLFRLPFINITEIRRASEYVWE